MCCLNAFLTINLDNVVVAIEVLHFMKAKTRGEDRYVALKLDINKACDRMDWNYLRAVLNKMGFHNCWIHWMCTCVESVDYFVLVNGTQVGPIIPGRVSVKGILSLHTCLLFVAKHRRFPIFCSLMIGFFFSKLMRIKYMF